MRWYACAGSLRWSGIWWWPQVGWPYNWGAASIFPLFPGCFSIVDMRLCSVQLELSGRQWVHIIKRFLLLVVMCLLHLDLVPGSCLLGAPFGALWIRTVVPPTGAVSDVVCLGGALELVECIFDIAWNWDAQLSGLVIPLQSYSAL